MMWGHFSPRYDGGLGAGPGAVRLITSGEAEYHTRLVQGRLASLSHASTVISGMLIENKIKVVAGYYDLGSGKVELMT